MARWILLGGSVAWLVAGVGGLALAGPGIGPLQDALPPLAIDTDALRGAVTAVSAGLLAIGLAHMVVLAGLRTRQRLAWSAGVLLAGFLSATLVALAAASVTSAVATPEQAPTFAAAAAATGVAAIGYGLVAVGLVGELRSGSAS